MKFFVDTADVAEIKDLAASGLLDGVTTNPSLIMKAGRPMLDVIKEICAIVPGPVSAETVATDHKRMLEEGHKLAKLAKKYKLGLLSNIDDKLLGQTRRHIPTDFDLVVTAQQVRSYKPDLAHFTECARRMGGKRGWVHVAASHYHDVTPCIKQRVPVIWVNRNKETLDSSQKKPTAEVPNLKEAAKLLGIG